ncbi:aspartate 1-decarboxylase [Cohnella fermenti]|uniref:Aspartate 1-decarboxylase n=1 Tax=Cohnella fermenti TaxID=2565925 RepID=A0A4S4BPA3_9BACL|nr:aspartate 1-decarboxylase [Cohnella fermenti]THF76551.1 aspartate 1-decarboxylase [Cohnella fermenti]
MKRLFCKSKIHRAVVTEAELDYVGSITIDALLMKQAGILPYEIVQVTSLRNATRWKTYALPGPEGAGGICLNGPPAHLFAPGDLVIILSMAEADESEVQSLIPRVVFVDRDNRITGVEDHPLFNEDGEVNWIALQPKQAR